MSRLLLTQLFEQAHQFTPYLQGYYERPDLSSSIYVVEDNRAVIQQLYHDLQTHAPEAGAAYWLTRTWDLLCWQPLSLALISIYYLSALPNIQVIRQFTHPQWVSGFYFESDFFEQGTQPSLIDSAGQQLQLLFESYRCEIDQWLRIRPGFTQHLLADNILNGLLRLRTLSPLRSHEELLEQAKLWLDACQLPRKHMNSLKINPNNNQLQLVRTSCCLVYKCTGRVMCADCPRQRREQPRNVVVDSL